MATIFRNGGDAAPPGAPPEEPPGLVALARDLREQERRALLEADGPARRRAVDEAALLRARLEQVVADALARGQSLAGISAAAMPASDARARFEAMGRLAAACARSAEIEEVLVDEGRSQGGEMPAGRTAQFQRALARARGELHAAVRAAVLRGVAPATIVEITRAAGLAIEEGDLVVAFEVRADH
jgi:hypothetical protein